MKYYVQKCREEGNFMISITKSGYKTAVAARKAGQKASKKYWYVEVGQFDENEKFPKTHVIDMYEYGEMIGGELLWDSLTQANQQALEEAPTVRSVSISETSQAK